MSNGLYHLRAFTRMAFIHTAYMSDIRGNDLFGVFGIFNNNIHDIRTWWQIS